MIGVSRVPHSKEESESENRKQGHDFSFRAMQPSFRFLVLVLHEIAALSPVAY